MRTRPRGAVRAAPAGLLLFSGDIRFVGSLTEHVNSGVPAPSSVMPGIPAAVDQLVLAATSRMLLRDARPTPASSRARSASGKAWASRAGSPA